MVRNKIDRTILQINNTFHDEFSDSVMNKIWWDVTGQDVYQNLKYLLWEQIRIDLKW